MNLTRLAAACLSLSFCGLSCAAAVTIDFNSLANGASLNQRNIDGFVFNLNGLGWVGNANSCGPSCAWNGTNYVLSLGAELGIRSASGTAFSLTQFDAAEAHANVAWIWAQQIHVVGLQSGGDKVVADFTLDGINDSYGPLDDFQTFRLGAGFGDLVSVTISGIGGGFNYHTLDNIVLNDPVANDLPEPGSLALAALALLGAGLAARRQRPTNA